MNKTKIEWSDYSLNPVVGCTFGCAYCYAKRLNDRYRWIPDFSKPQFYEERLKKLDLKSPKVVFMDSMSDVADWSDEAKEKVAEAMAKNNQHTYLFLTKRPGKIQMPIEACKYWLGVSITNQEDLDRINQLLFEEKYEKCFISFEPLSGSIDLNQSNANLFDWFIIGAETGNRKARTRSDPSWVKSIVDYASENHIPVFMKDSLVPVVGESNMLREYPKNIRNEKGEPLIGGNRL